ncbi:Phycobilisome Linker polypeptide [Gracilaria domingensis]|nr:Phycobilisome Linker polypeptide [Gracilaria domingensis]
MTHAAFTAPLPLTARPSSFVSCQNIAAPSPPRHAISRRTPRMAFSSIEGILAPNAMSMPEDLATVISSIYKQVLGNAHVMQSERDELRAAESQFCLTGNVREFVRSIAKSDAYVSRFFEPVSQYRFIELAFKHLLGSAPVSKAQYCAAMAKYHEEGYEACIDWFIDSEAYEEDFGEYIVPYGMYKGCYTTNELFNRSVAMRLTPSSSDKERSTMLQYCVLTDQSPSWLSIAKALPPGTEKGTGYIVGGRYTSTQWNRDAPVRMGTKIPGGVVFYG